MRLRRRWEESYYLLRVLSINSHLTVQLFITNIPRRQRNLHNLMRKVWLFFLILWLKLCLERNVEFSVNVKSSSMDFLSFGRMQRYRSMQMNLCSLLRKVSTSTASKILRLSIKEKIKKVLILRHQKKLYWEQSNSRRGQLMKKLLIRLTKNTRTLSMEP